MQLPVRLEIVRSGPQAPEVVERVELDVGRYTLGRSKSCSICIADDSVSRVHLTLDVGREKITVQDNASTNGTRIGGDFVDRADWNLKESIFLPGHEIRVACEQRPTHTLVTNAPAEPPPPLGSVVYSRLVATAAGGEGDGNSEFPNDILNAAVVTSADVRLASCFAGEWEYLALGGGLGSFVWVDHLRIYGVPEGSIRVIGVNSKCYANYERYTRNSQIPRHERIRSNSTSTPDNIWGYPGYASREAWRALKHLRLRGFAGVLQVFGEPALAETYTPMAGDVFNSLDREMERIGWSNIFIRGRVVRVRKTDDGRFAVAWRELADAASGGRRENVALARFIHFSTGYPATRFTEDLQDFLARFPNDRHLIVNAYDSHEHIYQEIERSERPATLVVRGRGIVASRVIQRLYEARAKNRNISILHQMRSRIPDGGGSVFERARRLVINDVEIQPFNWPKASWGGELLRDLERATPDRRVEILSKLGGTTTADRGDWVRLAREGMQQGWYRKVFGTARVLEPVASVGGRKVRMEIATPTGTTDIVEGDFVIDCTGLIANAQASPLLNDLVSTYPLPRNRVSGPGAEQRLTGIAVSNDFEIEGLRNGRGRAYASGATTQNGPHAAVDSFLGLQYAALRSVDHLHKVGAPDVAAFGPLRSFSQWLKWCAGARP